MADWHLLVNTVLYTCYNLNVCDPIGRGQCYALTFSICGFMVSQLKKVALAASKTKLRVSIALPIFLTADPKKVSLCTKELLLPTTHFLFRRLHSYNALSVFHISDNQKMTCRPVSCPRPQIRPADKAELDSTSLQIKACWTTTSSVIWHWVLLWAHAASVKRISMGLWIMRRVAGCWWAGLCFPGRLDYLI